LKSKPGRVCLGGEENGRGWGGKKGDLSPNRGDGAHNQSGFPGEPILGKRKNRPRGGRNPGFSSQRQNGRNCFRERNLSLKTDEKEGEGRSVLGDVSRRMKIWVQKRQDRAKVLGVQAYTELGDEGKDGKFLFIGI